MPVKFWLKVWSLKTVIDGKDEFRLKGRKMGIICLWDSVPKQADTRWSGEVYLLLQCLMMGFQLLVKSVKGIQTWENKNFRCHGVGHRGEAGVGNKQWGPSFPSVGWALVGQGHQLASTIKIPEILRWGDMSVVCNNWTTCQTNKMEKKGEEKYKWRHILWKKKLLWQSW